MTGYFARVPLAALSAVCGIFVIVSSILAALVMNPGHDIVTHYLSDLGNSGLSAAVFNTGLIAGGVLLLPFFAGISRHMGSSVLTKSGAVLGVFSALSLISIGLFPAAYFGDMHFFLAITFFVFAELSMVLLSMHFLVHRESKLQGTAGLLLITFDALLLVGVSGAFVEKLLALVMAPWLLSMALNMPHERHLGKI